MARNLEKYRVRVLYEDRKHFDFIRGFLLSQGVKNARRFFDIELPEGTQSGEQFVRERFISEFQKYARSRENKMLVVVQDIDRDEKMPEDVKNIVHLSLLRTSYHSLINHRNAPCTSLCRCCSRLWSKPICVQR